MNTVIGLRFEPLRGVAFVETLSTRWKIVLGGKSFSMATMRSSSGAPKRVSAAAVVPPATVTSDGISYSRALLKKSGETTGQSIDCFLDKFKGYGKQDLMFSWLGLRKRHRRRGLCMTEKWQKLETRGRKVLSNRSNANKFSSLLPQLKRARSPGRGSSH